MALDHGQFCPVALGAEILAERWTPRIVAALLAGPRRFVALRDALPGISRNLLVQRLASLERAAVLERRPRADGPGHEYALTAAGDALAPVLAALAAWGARWPRGRRR